MNNVQDAVQTLIDAVQELIQTHEACEQQSSEARQDRGVYITEENRLENLVPVEDETRVIVPGEEEGAPQVISEEVWRNLREVYPDAEFVVVDSQ